jgi:hypothetical protein
MTNPRTPNPAPLGPQPPRLRPSDERALLAASGRTTRQIALFALALAVLALVLVTWRTVVSGSTPGTAGTAGATCQTAAWDAAPAADQLPQGWTLKGATYEVNRKSVSFVGPQPADTTTSQAVVYVTVTCYAEGAADAVTRASAASTAAGQTVTARPDLGDQAFAAVDASGAEFLQLRHGNVVVDLAASGDATPTEVDTLASAFDRALGGNGGTIASPAPSGAAPSGGAGASSSPSASGAGASASPAAPALEKALPTKVGTVALTVTSAVGTTILGTDQGSRAITAALRADGKTADALQVAQAYDDTSASDLTLLAIAVNGMSTDKLRKLVMDSWLAASGAGVTTSTMTMSGRTFTRVDYGDEGPIDYVTSETDKVIVITTADPAVAQQAAAALP